MEWSLKARRKSETDRGKIRKSRKTKEERASANKEGQDRALLQLIEENERIKRNPRIPRKKKTSIGEFWGDKLAKDKEWPGITDSNTIKFFGQNTNGISYQNKYLDWGITL